MNGLPAGYIEFWGQVWGDDGSGPYVVDRSGAVSLAAAPRRLYTDNGGEGPNSRLRVDVGQTGFFAGREFRTFHQLSIAAAGVQVIKAVVPINIILFGLEVVITSGDLVVETVVSGTEGGAFSTALPILPRNTMTERPTPLYTPQVALSTGGTLTGGTVIDLLLNKTADNANFAASVGVNSSDERGIGAGTYYFRITAGAAVSGLLKARWEERP